MFLFCPPESERLVIQPWLTVYLASGAWAEIMSNVLKLAEIKFQYISDKFVGILHTFFP